MNYSSSISRFFTDRSCLLAHLLFSVVSPTAHRLFTRPSRHFIFTGIKCCDNALISIPCLHSRTDMVPFSINASTSLFFIFCQKSFLLSFIWGLYCCFLPSKWDQNGLILGTKKFGEHSPNSVVLLHFAAEIAYCCFHLLHRQKKPRRVHASAKRYQILASNSDGVNATTLLWAKSRTFRVII